jgi:hypothetical protein
MLNDDSILYHYCSVDVFVNILKTHSIWLTHAREMNDFHEDILFRKPLKTALQSFVNRSEPERQLLQQIVDEYTKRADFPYVACFSRDKDMLSQWRAYADDGKGVAIGLNLGKLPHFDLFMQKHGECISKPVIIDEVSYTQEDDDVEFMKKILSACLINYQKVKNETEVLRQGIIALNRLSIFSKGRGFEEEHEVHMVYHPCYRNLLANLNRESPKGHEHDDIEFRVRDGRILSYFTYQLPMEAIHSVVLGPKCPVDFAQLTLFLNRYAPPIRINNEIHRSRITYR